MLFITLVKIKADRQLKTSFISGVYVHKYMLSGHICSETDCSVLQ